MAPRAYWKGHVRLSLVSFPVQLFSAAATGSRVSFHQIHRPSTILTLVQYGFAPTREWLYVRLDSDRRLADLLADGYAFSLKFLQPAGVRFVVRMAMGRVG